MALLVLAVLVWLGAKAPTLRLRPFIYMALCAIPAVALQAYTVTRERALQERDQGDLWQPEVFIANVVSGFVLWSIVYLLGHAVGRIWRWRRQRRQRVPQAN